MNIHDQLYRKARKSKKQLDWVSYKRKGNFVKNEIQRTEKNFISKELRINSNKPDKFWNTVKNFTPQSENLQNLQPLFVQMKTKCLPKRKALLMDSVNSFLLLQIV